MKKTNYIITITLLGSLGIISAPHAQESRSYNNGIRYTLPSGKTIDLTADGGLTASGITPGNHTTGGCSQGALCVDYQGAICYSGVNILGCGKDGVVWKWQKLATKADQPTTQTTQKPCPPVTQQCTEVRNQRGKDVYYTYTGDCPKSRSGHGKTDSAPGHSGPSGGGEGGGNGGGGG